MVKIGTIFYKLHHLLVKLRANTSDTTFKSHCYLKAVVRDLLEASPSLADATQVTLIKSIINIIVAIFKSIIKCSSPPPRPNLTLLYQVALLGTSAGAHGTNINCRESFIVDLSCSSTMLNIL